MPAIRVVTARYITPAAAKTGKNLKFWATICWLRRVSSFTAITEASEVPLSTLIASLPTAGRIARIAWGSTMRRRVSSGPMPRDAAARVWLRLTERMPPRMISPAKAASLREKPMIAVVTGGITMPMNGSASNRNTSWSRTGVPRTSQT